MKRAKREVVVGTKNERVCFTNMDNAVTKVTRDGGHCAEKNWQTASECKSMMAEAAVSSRKLEVQLRFPVSR